MKRELVLIYQCLHLAAYPSVAFAAKPTQEGRFDLVCNTRGHSVFVRDPRRDPVPGRIAPSVWSFKDRYVFDLKRALYWGTDWVGPPEKIRLVTKTHIYLVKTSEGYERIDRRTGRFSGYARGTGFMDEVNTGHCRRARFSGFPSR